MAKLEACIIICWLSTSFALLARNTNVTSSSFVIESGFGIARQFSYNTTIVHQYKSSSTPFIVFDICKFDQGCNRQFKPTASCIAVTPQCNCLQWVGTLNTSISSETATEINIYTSKCVRIICTGNCTVSINWSLQPVGTTVPVGLISLAQIGWSENKAKYWPNFGAYAYSELYSKVCDTSGFAAQCPTITQLNVVFVPFFEKYKTNLVFVAGAIQACIIVFIGLYSIKILLQLRKKLP